MFKSFGFFFKVSIQVYILYFEEIWSYIKVPAIPQKFTMLFIFNYFLVEMFPLSKQIQFIHLVLAVVIRTLKYIRKLKIEYKIRLKISAEHQ